MGAVSVGRYSVSDKKYYVKSGINLVAAVGAVGCSKELTRGLLAPGRFDAAK
jgi:hypothetical protein